MIIPNDFIQQVKHANNIVTVAAKYLPIKQKGRGYWACCPFHNEKTPSFSINEQNQFYHCFGCGVSGNVISLVRHLENTDFVGAVEILAKMVSLKMPEVSASPKQLEQQRKKQRVLEIIEEARKYYNSILKNTKHENAIKYLHGRGIGDDLIDKFNIGLSPDWDGILIHLRGKGYTEGELVDAGIAAKSLKGKVYDAMGERITFAIFDLYGNCIGFTGRVLPEKDNGEVAKYRNTAQSLVFDKGKIVYGADVMKKYLRQNKMEDLIIVEGNVDVVSLVGAGFNCTLACMGTALTDFHAKALKRFSDQVYICFDGDAAGKKAALRSVDILATEGLMVRVISLPNDSDPDSFVRSNGKKAFQELINTAKPLVDYKLDALLEESNVKDNLGKTKYLNEAVQILKNIPSEIELELYIPKVAKVAGVSLDSIKRAATSKETKATLDSTLQKVSIPKSQDTAYTRAVNFIAASKLHGKDYAKDPLEFELGINLYDDILDKKIMDLFDILSPDELAEIDHLIKYDFGLGEEELAKNYVDSVDYIFKQRLREKREELQKLYNETSDSKYLQEIDELNRRIKSK